MAIRIFETMIDEFDIRRVKDATSIVEVMSEFVTLKKSGSMYECLCPFHDDNHIGNFKVNPRRNTYCCYSCGAWGDSLSFLEDYAGMDFHDAFYYLAAKYGIYVKGQESYKPKKKPTPCKPHTPPPALPVWEFNKKFLEKRRDLTDDNLYNWIMSLPWNDRQRERIPGIMDAYFVGHSRDGRSIFWQIDEIGRARTAKLMRYQPDGHRDKSRYSITWMHSLFEREGLFDPDKAEIHPTLFGMHLLDVSLRATVNIVESEKSALIAAIYFGEFKNDIWMATGGKTRMTYDYFLPIIARKRKVNLYPDIDAIEVWKKLAQELDYDKVKLQDRFMLNNWNTEKDGPKADIADIIVRLLYEQRANKTQSVDDVLDVMKASNPHLADLINRLHLTPVTP